MDAGTKRAVQGGVIALAGMLGLFWAAGAVGERAYILGLLIFAGAAVLEFRLIDAIFAARAGREVRLLPKPSALIPQSALRRRLAGIAAVLVSVLALFSASGIPAHHFAHEVALTIFVAAVIYVFVLIKADFDRRGHA